MTERETLAYSPGPAGKTAPGGTLIAPSGGAAPRAGAAAPSDASRDTMFAAESSAPTIMGGTTGDSAGAGTLQTMLADGTETLPPGDTLPPDGPGGHGTIPPGGTRGYATVLPDVRSEGDRLIIVPRDQRRYERNKVLGRGAMGEVKLAHDHDIGRKIAVKRLLNDDNPHAVARFIDEVRMVGSLEHPNIVPIHDVGVDEDGALFFVMRYVEGETLQDIINKLAAGDPEYHARYSFEARLDLFAGLLRALQYAHDRGLVHRDVKPENIMVGRFGEVMLMDWGVAHRMRSEARPGPSQAQGQGLDVDRASTETVDGSVVGTPQYMSPEQASGQVAELDGRSDTYSAFVVLYELLSLRPYIEPGKTAMATVVAAQEAQAPAVVSSAYEHPHQTAVPVELRHFMRDGLANDRDKRHGSASEVLLTLEHVRSGDFAVACPITFMKHNNTMMGRFMDRHPIASMWLATASALAFIGGVGGWVMWAVS